MVKVFHLESHLTAQTRALVSLVRFKSEANLILVRSSAAGFLGLL